MESRSLMPLAVLLVGLTPLGCERAPAAAGRPVEERTPPGGPAALAAQPAGERQAVAGRDEPVTLEHLVRAALDATWTVERGGDRVVAVRKPPHRPWPGARAALSSELAALRHAHGALTARAAGDVVSLGGQVAHCEDAARAAGRLAAIRGIHRIAIEVSCLGP